MPIFEQKSVRLSGYAAILLLGIALIFPPGLLAEEQTDQTVQPASQPGTLDIVDTQLESLDARRNYVSKEFVTFVSNIDRFFGDDRNYLETNKSVIQLDLTKVSGYGGRRNPVFSGRAKLDMPSAEKRLHLLFESDPEKNITGETPQGQPVVQNQVETPDKLAVGAGYVKEKKTLWYFSTDAGIQIHTPVEPFVRARGSYSFPLEQWRMKLAETLFWFSTIGTGATTQLDIEHILSRPVLFRAASIATWLRDKQNFDLNQSFSIYHTLNDRSAVLYQASAIGVSNPQVQATEYILSMLYRYRLRQKWIYMELSPQLHFPKADNFKLNPALSFRLEILFDETR
jgi:hypothetical protein